MTAIKQQQQQQQNPQKLGISCLIIHNKYFLYFITVNTS